MTYGFRIRAASTFDTPLLEALHRASCTAEWDEAWSQQSFADILAMPGAVGLIASADDETLRVAREALGVAPIDPAPPGFAPTGYVPVGFALGRIAVDEAEVLLIATRPARRRRGIAQAMLAEMLPRLAGAGAKHVFLEVAASNVAALALYRAAGFRAVGSRPNYYRGREATIDALVLTRELHDIS